MKLRWLRGALTLGLVVLTVVFVGLTLRDYLSQASAHALSPGVPAMILGFALAVLWLGCFELAWEWGLRRHCLVPGQQLSWLVSADAFIRSLLSRYVPGKVWPALVRMQCLRAHIPGHSALQGYIFEQLHYGMAALVLALYAAPMLLPQTHRHPLLLPMGLVAVLLVLVWLLFPRQILGLAQRLLASWLPDTVELGLHGSSRDWMIGFGGFLASSVLQGVALLPFWWSLQPGVARLSWLDWSLIIAAYSAARIVGQLAILLPGGLGVREGAYALLTLGYVDGGVGALIALWGRLFSVLAELGCFLMLQLLRRSGC